MITESNRGTVSSQNTNLPLILLGMSKTAFNWNFLYSFVLLLQKRQYCIYLEDSNRERERHKRKGPSISLFHLAAMANTALDESQKEAWRPTQLSYIDGKAEKSEVQ